MQTELRGMLRRAQLGTADLEFRARRLHLADRERISEIMSDFYVEADV